ncbi:phenol hydroxylase subunit P4 [Pseudomonas nicosulfuronedens]
MSVIAIGTYTAQPLDRQANFHGAQLVYLCWENHLMFCAPFTLPVNPTQPFAEFVEQVVKPAISQHPDAAQVDFAAVQWRLDDQPFTPDPARGLTDNGVAHKSLLHLHTPGLEGLGGSRN